MSRLKSISVTDFRSIRGTISASLDAPIVLIHGQNGAGKTSLLSAIELGLTGKVSSFDNIYHGYRSHLVHKGAEFSRILIETDGLQGSKDKADITITPSATSGRHLLDESSARFYSERCFLAQSALTRLLEIYENNNYQDSASPLTKFVKDLLGLDQLDSLIDGLHDAGDVRRVRSKSPLFRETREDIPRVKEQLRLKSEEIAQFKARDGLLREKIVELGRKIGLGSDLEIDRNLVHRLSGDKSEDEELRALNSARIDVSSIRQQWTALSSVSDAVDRDAAEAKARDSQRAVQLWQVDFGAKFVKLVSEARQIVREVSPIDSSGPGDLFVSIMTLLESELKTCIGLLSLAAEDDRRIQTLTKDAESARERIRALDDQIAQQAKSAGQEAQLLTEVLSHVHGDDCPVCGRDFQEVSRVPLNLFLTQRISGLNQGASRMRELTSERDASNALVISNERAISTLTASRMNAEAVSALHDRQVVISELMASFKSMEATIIVGQQLTEIAKSAVQVVSEQQALDLRIISLRESVVKLAAALVIDLSGSAEAMGVVIDRIGEAISMRAEKLLNQQAIRRELVGYGQELLSLSERSRSAESVEAEIRLRIQELEAHYSAAESLILDARSLEKRARSSRTAIVRRVFNQELNTMWRDLFVRLAPEEPFIPRFALPNDEDGPVEALLETIHRAGEVGGNPRAMLSAGNLNTAALTLFLALHLSVSPTLPWLVIDDPVQSMDEVHIAQLTALIRSISKMHGRQIIMAVHEKPLFDYLSLELSPAFESDRLITIELSRGSDGETSIDFKPHVWIPDRAIAA